MTWTFTMATKYWCFICGSRYEHSENQRCSPILSVRGRFPERRINLKNRLTSISLFFLISPVCFASLVSAACTPLVVPTTSTDNGTGPWAGHADKVEFVYFHATQQCATCLCFEKHITKIMQETIRTDKRWFDYVQSIKFPGPGKCRPV